jgi:hypothetical protein
MRKTTGDALRDLADAMDRLKNVIIITARNEIMAMMGRLRIMAIHEDDRPAQEDVEPSEDFGIENVGKCDACGSRLVWRGRNPMVLRCPLECDSTGV